MRGCAEVAANQQGPHGMHRVLLMSDGHANQGVTDREELRRHAGELARRGVATWTFGFGSDFDEDLMEGIALAGGGQSFYVESPAQIRDHITSAIGEALDVVARGVELRIQAPEGVLVEPLSLFRSHRTGDTTIVELGDLVSDQQLRLVLKVNFPFGQNGLPIGIRIGLADQDGAMAIPPTEVAFEYADGRTNDAQRREHEVDREVARLYAARARKEATQLNRHGDFSAANRLLQGVARRIRRVRRGRSRAAPAGGGPGAGAGAGVGGHACARAQGDARPGVIRHAQSRRRGQGAQGPGAFGALTPRRRDSGPRGTPRPCGTPVAAGTPGTQHLRGAVAPRRRHEPASRDAGSGLARRSAGSRPAAAASSAVRGGRGAAALERRQAGLDLEVGVGVLERLELIVEAGRGDLGHAAGHRLFAADLLLHARQVARGIAHVDALERLLDLALGLGHLLARDQLVALVDQLLALGAQAVQGDLELLHEDGLLGDAVA